MYVHNNIRLIRMHAYANSVLCIPQAVAMMTAAMATGSNRVSLTCKSVPELKNTS